jgi:hypothetical protein
MFRAFLQGAGSGKGSLLGKGRLARANPARYRAEAMS